MLKIDDDICAQFCHIWNGLKLILWNGLVAANLMCTQKSEAYGLMIWLWPKVESLCLCYGLEEMDFCAMNGFMMESSCFDAYHVYGYCLVLNATYSYGLWKIMPMPMEEK